MMRLLSSELLRFRSRRVVKLLTLLAIIGIVVGAVIATATSKRPAPQQVAFAEEQSRREVERCVRKDGFQDAFGPREEGQSLQQYCEAHLPVEVFLESDQLRVSDLSDYLMAGAFVLIVIGLVIGASMVGASWQTGTITTILTWEPRRLRWLSARMIVVALGVFVVVMALLAFTATVLTLGASLRGSTSAASGWIGDTVETALRIAAVASAIAVIGAAVASIGRSTTAALGTVFVYLAVLESLVRGFRPLWSRFMLGDSAVTFISGMDREIRGQIELQTVSPSYSAVVIGVYVAVLVVAALGMMRTRDVT